MQIVSRPKGLIVFAVLQAVTYLSAVPTLFKADQHFISFGMLIAGPAFTVISLAQIVIGTSIAVGLANLKRWAYLGFFGISGYFVASLLVNALLVDQELLIRAGWSVKPSTVSTYRVGMAVALGLVVVFCAWLLRYRQQFKAANQAL